MIGYIDADHFASSIVNISRQLLTDFTIISGSMPMVAYIITLVNGIRDYDNQHALMIIIMATIRYSNSLSVHNTTIISATTGIINDDRATKDSIYLDCNMQTNITSLMSTTKSKLLYFIIIAAALQNATTNAITAIANFHAVNIKYAKSRSKIMVAATIKQKLVLYLAPHHFQTGLHTS